MNFILGVYIGSKSQRTLKIFFSSEKKLIIWSESILSSDKIPYKVSSVEVCLRLYVVQNKGTWDESWSVLELGESAVTWFSHVLWAVLAAWGKCYIHFPGEYAENREIYWPGQGKTASNGGATIAQT